MDGRKMLCMIVCAMLVCADTELSAPDNVCMDPIHGLIELHPLHVKIIDTPEFQRMRNIKQLGMCYYVYPGASHNRFEHSIGACHLAGRFVRKLRERLHEEKKQYQNQNLSEEERKKIAGLKLDITAKEELCVEIAGLCHDLGHGPFSHVFDKTLIPKCKEKGDSTPPCAVHENRSVAVLRQLIKENQLKPEFKKFGIDDDKHIDFIGELITASKKKPIDFKQKGKENNFLYEIVSNKNNGIDVDKWDYFARDCHMLGIKNDFDHNRCIEFAKVNIDDDGFTHICYRDKEVHNLYEMFHTRFKLHVRAYQHKDTHILDHEVADVLLEVRKEFKINGTTLNDIILTLLRVDDVKKADMTDFCLLTDDILSEIWRNPDEAFPKAKQRIREIYSRKFPKLIRETFSLKEDLKLGTDEELKTELLEGSKINHEDVVVLTMKLDYGQKKENPIDNVKFYKKATPHEVETISREEVSLLLPTAFSESKVRVYCRDGVGEEQREALKDRFKEWRIGKEAPLPAADETG